MLGMKVNRGVEKVGITLNSFFWFFVVTAAATAIGEWAYAEYIEPRLDTDDDNSGENYVVLPDSAHQ